MKYPIAIVTWGDAVTYEDGDTEPRHEPVVNITIGWLLKRDKRGVTVCSEYEKDDPTTWRDEYHIPGGMIQRVQIVRK